MPSLNFRPRRRDHPELNLIPMIDVLIVLLIFLVLTTTFSREAELQIQLPEATGQAPAEEKGIQVVVFADGRYTVNNHQTVNNRTETLAQALREAAGGKKDPLIVIDADRNATHQSVMTVLDAASQDGYTHITFAAKADPGDEPLPPAEPPPEMPAAPESPAAPAATP